MDSLPTTTERTIHYHTGFLTCPQNTAMGIAGAVAVTALVIGILALLQSYNIIHLNYVNLIPQQGIFGLLGGGGGLLAIDAIVLIVLAVKHQQGKKTLYFPERDFPAVMPANRFFRPLLYNAFCMTDAEGNKSFHLFGDDDGDYISTLLESEELTPYFALEAQTQATVHLHGEDKQALFDFADGVAAIEDWKDALKKLPEKGSVYSYYKLSSAWEFAIEFEEDRRFHCILQSQEGTREIHLFNTKDEADAYIKALGADYINSETK